MSSCLWERRRIFRDISLESAVKWIIAQEEEEEVGDRACVWLCKRSRVLATYSPYIPRKGGRAEEGAGRAMASPSVEGITHVEIRLAYNTI